MRLRHLLLLLATLWIVTDLARGQASSIDRTQAFLDLGNDLVVMDLSAHPDDEDGATLAYYRMHLGAKTYSVLFTRGEGGQNEKGPELYEELGVIRSRETRAAGAILGTEVVFLNLLDFGFSKTATETFRIWGGQTEVLRRLVYVIRKYKPDILFTNHNTIDGHGNHQAVAITALAAFDAAADSTMFPEQLRESGVALWQPRKLFFRSFGRYEPVTDVANPVNTTDSVRGATYVELAGQALRMHKTQGMDRVALRSFTRGKSDYRLVRTSSLYEPDSTSFLGGIDLWRDKSVAALRPLRETLSLLRPGMDRDSLLALSSRAMGRMDSLSRCCGGSPLASRLLYHWHDALQRLLKATCGIHLAARLQDSTVVAGQRTDCDVEIGADQCLVSGVRWRFQMPAGWAFSERGDAAPQFQSNGERRDFTLAFGDDALPTVPRVVMQYTSLQRHQDINAIASCTVNGYPLTFSTPVHFDVAPLQTVTADPAKSAYIPGRTQGPVPFRWVVRNWQPRPIGGTVSVEGPQGWKATSGRFANVREDSTASGEIRLTPPEGVPPGVYRFRVRTGYAATTISVNVFRAEVAKGTMLGIIESYDNTLETAARQLNVPYAMLEDDAIKGGDLSRYSTIVIDIRSYLVRDALKTSNDRLLDYVKAGGNLVVMYQRDQEWKPEYAPYPFQISRKRITVEEAPVTVLEPGHPLFTQPNRIGSEAWEGWKQERGVYFPSDVPPQYTRLLSCADPDEEPLTTGYLVARYGKGSYIYTSYVWYRQMKEEHPGAFRCFANMISYSHYRK